MPERSAVTPFFDADDRTAACAPHFRRCRVRFVRPVAIPEPAHEVRELQTDDGLE